MAALVSAIALHLPLPLLLPLPLPVHLPPSRCIASNFEPHSWQAAKLRSVGGALGGLRSAAAALCFNASRQYA